MIGSPLESEIIKQLGDDLSYQIDKDIIWNLCSKDRYPYSCVDSSNGKFSPAQDEWLQENIGDRVDKWDWNSNNYYFKNKKDLTLFLLRWS